MRWTEDQLKDYQSRSKQLAAIGEAYGLKAKASDSHKTPNKTESEYRYRLELEFVGCRAIFEGMTLRMANGHKYTADWMVVKADGSILLVEIKNAAYQHASYGRSKLAFNQCRVEYPMFSYRWAEKEKGSWSEVNYDRNNPTHQPAG